MLSTPDIKLQSINNQNHINQDQTNNQTNQIKTEILSLISEAESLKSSDIHTATKTLYIAANKLKYIEKEQDKASVKNATQDKETLEIIYLSKKGKLLYEIEEYNNALDSYKQIQKKIPANFKVYKAIGDCHRKLHNYNEALKQYSIALERYENDENASKTDKAAILNSKGLTEIALDSTSFNVDHLNNALEIFKEVIKLNPNSPLYHCNLGKVYHALSEKDSAILSFQKAHELIENNKFDEELNSENKAYIEKVLNEFVSQVKDLNKISLEKKDDVIAKRENKFIDTKLESLTNIDNEELNQELNKEHKKILIIKQKLKIIQGIPPIHEYYDGFIFNINKSYSTALVVNSDIFNISTSNLAVDTASTLISLIPLVGEQLSKVVTTVKEFVIEAQTKKAANNVCKFASGVTEFKSLAQEAVLDSIFSRKDALSTIDPEKYILRTWSDKFKNLVEKTQDKIETKLYGTRDETPMQKLGYKDSCELVEKIASGEIYKGEIAVRISPAEKASRLNNEASSIIDKELANWSKQYTEQPQTVKNVQVANKTPCCLIFAQNDITYDNELLNHPNILKSLLSNYGLLQILDLSSQLDKDLILEASITNDPEIVLAGLMSIESSYYSILT